MKKYPIFNNLVDIFLGDGWEQWSRWKLIKNTWVQIAGLPVENEILIISTLKGK